MFWTSAGAFSICHEHIVFYLYKAFHGRPLVSIAHLGKDKFEGWFRGPNGPKNGPRMPIGMSRVPPKVQLTPKRYSYERVRYLSCVVFVFSPKLSSLRTLCWRTSNTDEIRNNIDIYTVFIPTIGCRLHNACCSAVCFSASVYGKVAASAFLCCVVWCHTCRGGRTAHPLERVRPVSRLHRLDDCAHTSVCVCTVGDVVDVVTRNFGDW